MKSKLGKGKTKIRLLVGGLLCSFFIAAAAPGLNVRATQTANSQKSLEERFLKADGKVLKNNSGTGDVVTLRGTNIGGWQVMESWMCPTNAGDQKTAITTLTERFGKDKAEELFKIYEQSWMKEKDFDNLKDLNFNALRLPVSCYNLLDEEGKLRADTLTTLDWFVAECEKREMYVILDLHAAPGSQNGRDHSGDKSGSLLYKDENYQNLTLSLWEQLAEHYKGNSTIAGYDLLNEAEGDEKERAPWGPVQLPFFDRLYKAIRAIDPDHLIIINAVWEPTNIPHPEQYGWENVMYEYHYYCWDGTDNAVTQRNFTESKVKKDDQAGHEVPVLIGEFTLFDKLPSWEHALSVYEEHGWSWTTWTYKTVNMGNWGIYNSTNATTPKVDILKDTYETIAEKWGNVDTETRFTRNDNLADLLSVFANKEEAKNNPRKWFHDVDSEMVLRAGTDATAEVVSGDSLYDKRGDGDVIKLTVTGIERIPRATTRNVCITPMVRNSVDATGLPYLMFYTYSREGNRALYVTLVDKNGATWSEYTNTAASPAAYLWDKVFLDLSKATIDVSAIIEIRIGVNVPGTYHFDDFYFAGSYADLLPEETEEMMKNDMGVEGVITDWEDVPASSEGKKAKKSEMNGLLTIGILAAICISTTTLTAILIFKRRKHNKGGK
ncbi:MAG: glycoside hydrolase [Herbinix sp.]|jgi:hypothetical protein|nr:glycoside hydrolase [Herbinix sp.]